MASAQVARSRVDAAPSHRLVVARRRPMGGPFWRLWWATGISSTGDGLVTVALPLLAVTITRNPLAIAGVTASNKLFAALAALPAGVLADRFERRRVMFICNVLAGAGLLALVGALAAGVLDLAMVYVIAAVIAICNVTYTLALQACFPDIVAHPEQLATANGRLMGAQNSGEQFVGPACGGLMFAAGRSLPFLADGASFFFSAGLIKSIAPRPRRRGLHFQGLPRGGAGAGVDGPPSPSVDGLQGGWGASFREGWRSFRDDRALKLLAASTGSAVFAQNMVFGLLVLYGKETLKLSSTGYGIFLALAAVFGVAGALVGGPLERRFGGPRIIIGGLVLVAASYMGLAGTHLVVLAVFVFGLQEVGVAVANVGSVTTRQRLIPRNLYGRMASVYRLIVAGAGPLGALFGGAVASAAKSTPAAFFIAGLIEVVVVVVMGPALVRRLGLALRRLPVNL